MKQLFARGDQFILMRMIAAISIAYLLLPFIVVFGASFDTAHMFHATFPPRELTLQWYEEIPPEYYQAAWRSLVVALAVAVISTIIGGFAAFGVIRSRVVAKEVFLSFFRLPVQVPLVVTGAVFLQWYHDLAAMTGMNVVGSLWAVIIAHVFVAVPYTVGSIASVLARFDMALEEAAHSLGANYWSTFWFVTVPNIKAGVLGGMIYAFIVSFGDVPIAFFITADATSTLPARMFIDMQVDFRPSMLALSSVIVVFSVAIVIILNRMGALSFTDTSRR